MIAQPFIDPTREQFKQLMALGETYKGPVMMVNLLKFKKDGGRETYQKYATNTEPHLKKVGGDVSRQGDVFMTVIGDEEWDEVIIADYPSIDKFIEMQRSEAYMSAVPYRTEALEDSRLIAVRRKIN